MYTGGEERFRNPSKSSPDGGGGGSLTRALRAPQQQQSSRVCCSSELRPLRRHVFYCEQLTPTHTLVEHTKHFRDFDNDKDYLPERRRRCSCSASGLIKTAFSREHTAYRAAAEEESTAEVFRQLALGFVYFYSLHHTLSPS